MLCFGWTCNLRQCSSQNGEQHDPQPLVPGTACWEC